MTYLQLVAGFVALIGGAEVLVRGASATAVRFGLSPLVVGLTVVAFGTSAPELAVSVGSAWRGNAGLAIGNVVGSNIANVLLVLGSSALFGGALVVSRKVVRSDVPLMVVASVVVFMMSLSGTISRFEGLLLAAGIVAYVVWTIRMARKDPDPPVPGARGAASPEVSHPGTDNGNLPASAWAAATQIVVGSAALVAGAHWLVTSATSIATSLGVSDLVIGLTVVAIGTSLPELATSVLAAARGERDLAVGNVVGSNLFNLLCVLGFTALVSPDGLPVGSDALDVEIPIMIAVAFACLPVFWKGYRLERWEGGLFVAYYLAYLVFVVLDATDSSVADPFGVAIIGFVIPITLITFVVLAWQGSSSHRGRRDPLSS